MTQVIREPYGQADAESFETKALKITTGAGSGKVLKSDADGNATWQNDTGGNVPISQNVIPKGTGITTEDGDFQFTGSALSPLINSVLATGWIYAPNDPTDGNSITVPTTNGGTNQYTYDSLDGFFSPTDGTTVSMQTLVDYINKQSTIAVTAYWNAGTKKIEFTAKYAGTLGNALGIDVALVNEWTRSGALLTGGIDGQNIGETSKKIGAIKARVIEGEVFKTPSGSYGIDGSFSIDGKTVVIEKGLITAIY